MFSPRRRRLPLAPYWATSGYHQRRRMFSPLTPTLRNRISDRRWRQVSLLAARCLSAFLYPDIP